MAELRTLRLVDPGDRIDAKWVLCGNFSKSMAWECNARVTLRVTTAARL